MFVGGNMTKIMESLQALSTLTTTSTMRPVFMILCKFLFGKTYIYEGHV